MIWRVRCGYMRSLAIALMLGVMTEAFGAADTLQPPVAPVRPVSDNYFGTKVVDPYRWMEDRASPEFIAYMLSQGAYARAVLDRIPGRDKLQARVAGHTGGGVLVSQVQTAGGRIFYLRRAPSENTFKLFVREKSGTDRLLVDPDRYARPGEHFAIDYYVPAPQGDKLAYGISPGGSEHSVIHIVDTTSGREAAETIDRAWFGVVAWLPDGSGLFYNRMVALNPGEPDTARYLNSKLYLHYLGRDPGRDAALIGTGVAGSPTVVPADIPFIFVQPGNEVAVGLISHGSEPALEVLIAPLSQASKPGARWRKVADTPDGVTSVALHGAKLYLLSHRDAPRYRIVALSVTNPEWSRSESVVAPSERVIEDIEPAADALYVRDLDGGVGRLRRYDFATRELTELNLPARGTVEGPITDPLRPGALFGVESWVVPPQWYRTEGTRSENVSLVPPWSEDLSGYTSEEVSVRARDGVTVPLSIVHRRDLRLDSKAPLWLGGYGAYGIAAKPRLAAARLVLLEDGGIYAVCHARGGGEFGEEWHQAGRMATKPNTYRDMIDCARYLQARGYASPETTAIESSSAGGITVGMAMVEQPELFRVVLSRVGDLNALRAEFETAGEANSKEYGSLKTEAGFKALFAIDAFSHVKDGTAYPAVLLTTGLNDPRVAPWQPGKMAARLQAASSSGRPVLLLVDPDAGHGMGSTKLQRDRETADQLAFMYWQIGWPAYQPR
jgi:prolyl oligopeptidase